MKESEAVGVGEEGVEMGRALQSGSSCRRTPGIVRAWPWEEGEGVGEGVGMGVGASVLSAASCLVLCSWASPCPWIACGG